MWIHGGGYILGMKEMVYMSRAIDLEVWNTRRNHIGWRMYLRKSAKKKVSPYASPTRQINWKGLPPAYTFVGDGEPFYAETLEFVRCLQEAGIEAKADVYHVNMHAFDMLRPDLPESVEAVRKFEEAFAFAARHYYAKID